MIELDDPIWHAFDGVSNSNTGMIEDGCPFCSSLMVVAFDGNCVCMTCSSIVERQLDHGAEWRYYGADDTRTSNPTRCFPPSNGLIQTLGTVVSAGPRRSGSYWRNRTEAAANAQQSVKSSGLKVQKFQTWGAMAYKDRVLCRVFDQMAVCASHHGVPNSILEDAKSVYKRVSEAHITRGESRSAVIAVAMYVAFKRSDVPRSVREVADMFRVRPAAMTRAMHIVQRIVTDADGRSSEADDFIGRFCSRLGMPPAAVQETRRIVARVDELNLVCDAMPPSIVGGVIMLVSERLGLGMSRDAIAAACMIAPVTVSKLHKRVSKSMINDQPAGGYCH